MRCQDLQCFQVAPTTPGSIDSIAQPTKFVECHKMLLEFGQIVVNLIPRAGWEPWLGLGQAQGLGAGPGPGAGRRAGPCPRGRAWACARPRLGPILFPFLGG